MGLDDQGLERNYDQVKQNSEIRERESWHFKNWVEFSKQGVQKFILSVCKIFLRRRSEIEIDYFELWGRTTIT